MFSGLGRLNSLKFTSSRCVEPGGEAVWVEVTV